MADRAKIQTDYTYRPAKRDKTAPLIMIAGPPGVGKTYSALRLARGMVGDDGKVFIADTDNGRALFYADEFKFEHLNLHEPFRPSVFENAAMHAQRQGASVLIIDNFMHEHAGPGGLLEWHEEINVRMATGNDGEVNFRRLEATKMLAWIEPKTAHKRMRERLYQMNCPIILCCGAEKKMAIVEVEENGRKKNVPQDQGYLPICGSDIPWAMTLSLMLEDVTRPGVPRPIKALLPALKPIVSLDRPIDEETGRRIAAWARGDKETPAPAAEAGRGGEETSKASVQQPSDSDEQRIKDGAQKLADRFLNTENLQAHQALVTEAEVQKQIAFLRRNRKPIYDAILEPAIRASFKRGQDVALQEQQPQEQGNLV